MTTDNDQSMQLLLQKKVLIQHEIKTLQGKINSRKHKIKRIEGQMLQLILQHKIANLPFKVGDVIEVISDDMAVGLWIPVRVTKLYLYSSEQPDLGMHYKPVNPKMRRYLSSRGEWVERSQNITWRLPMAETQI